MICSPVIQQSPKHLLQTLEEKEEKLFCRHGDSSYQYMYWYQQKNNGGSLELIGKLSYGTASQEEKFKPQFNITGHAKEDTFLHISSISVEDSAIYLCAASLHSHTVPFKRWQKNCSLCTYLINKKPQDFLHLHAKTGNTFTNKAHQWQCDVSVCVVC